MTEVLALLIPFFDPLSFTFLAGGAYALFVTLTGPRQGRAAPRTLVLAAALVARVGGPPPGRAARAWHEETSHP